MNGQIDRPDNISYNYDELLSELRTEAQANTLCEADTIQILRGDPVDVGKGKLYYPIVDWYYDDENMIELATITTMDTEDDIEEKQDILQNYNSIKDNLQELLVDDVLAEMEEWNRI